MRDTHSVVRTEYREDEGVAGVIWGQLLTAGILCEIPIDVGRWARNYGWVSIWDQALVGEATI